MEKEYTASQVEVDFLGLLKTLWQSKLLILSITLLFSLTSIVISLNLTEIYDSKATIIPSKSKSSQLSNGLSSLVPGGFSSFLSSGESDSVVALKSLNSRILFRKLYDDPDFLIELFYVLTKT